MSADRAFPQADRFRRAQQNGMPHVSPQLRDMGLAQPTNQSELPCFAKIPGGKSGVPAVSLTFSPDRVSDLNVVAQGVLL